MKLSGKFIKIFIAFAVIITLALIVFWRYRQNQQYREYQEKRVSSDRPGYEMLGGANSFCLNTPFMVDGKDLGYRVETFLGSYKKGMIPQFGKDKEAEVSADASGVITVKFHPTTNYESEDAQKDGSYWLYVGLMYPYYLATGNYDFPGCGYDGKMSLEDSSKEIHFKGDFKWNAEESQEPINSGFGNTLLGGHLAYNFLGVAQEVAAIDDFGAPPGGPYPTSLAEAKFFCGGAWHDLQWSDWYNPEKKNGWQEFDINVTAANKKILEESAKCRKGRDLGEADNTKIMGLFVGPEYGVQSGGASVFELKNLRMETK